MEVVSDSARIINDGRDLRIVGEEIVVEQIGERCPAVAQPAKQRNRPRLQVQVRDPLIHAGPRAKRLNMLKSCARLSAFRE